MWVDLFQLGINEHDRCPVELVLVWQTVSHFNHTDEELNRVSNLNVIFVIRNWFQVAKFLRKLCLGMWFRFCQLIHKRNLDVPPSLRSKIIALPLTVFTIGLPKKIVEDLTNLVLSDEHCCRRKSCECEIPILEFVWVHISQCNELLKHVLRRFDFKLKCAV